MNRLRSPARDWKFIASACWHVLAFVQLFACFAVPTIYESELNETASDEQLFGWPFINLSSWSILISLLFFFVQIILDFMPDKVSFRRKIDFYFSLVLAESFFCSLIASVFGIVWLCIDQESIMQSWHRTVRAHGFWGYTTWFFRYYLASVVIAIEACTVYHFHHGRNYVGVIFVVVYALITMAWHLTVYLVSGIWPQYFEAMLSAPALSVLAAGTVVVRALLYIAGKAFLRWRWSRHIERDASFAPFKGHVPQQREIPAIGGLDLDSDKPLLLDDELI